jgi:phosphatidylinositol alpha 1,6-mannosyltransferase
MGAAGRRAVLGRTWPSVCEELLGHYAAVLDGGAGRVGDEGDAADVVAA